MSWVNFTTLLGLCMFLHICIWHNYLGPTTLVAFGSAITCPICSLKWPSCGYRTSISKRHAPSSKYGPNNITLSIDQGHNIDAMWENSYKEYGLLDMN